MLQIRNTVFTPEEQIDIVTALRKSALATDLFIKVVRDISREREQTEPLVTHYDSTQSAPWNPGNPSPGMTPGSADLNPI